MDHFEYSVFSFVLSPTDKLLSFWILTKILMKRDFSPIRLHSVNTISASASLETLNIIEEENLIENSKVNGDYFISLLKELQKKI